MKEIKERENESMKERKHEDKREKKKTKLKEIKEKNRQKSLCLDGSEMAWEGKAGKKSSRTNLGVVQRGKIHELEANYGYQIKERDAGEGERGMWAELDDEKVGKLWGRRRTKRDVGRKER